MGCPAAGASSISYVRYHKALLETSAWEPSQTANSQYGIAHPRQEATSTEPYTDPHDWPFCAPALANTYRNNRHS
jgi:hypothetical protein